MVNYVIVHLKSGYPGLFPQRSFQEPHLLPWYQPVGSSHRPPRAVSTVTMLFNFHLYPTNVSICILFKKSINREHDILISRFGFCIALTQNPALALKYDLLVGRDNFPCHHFTWHSIGWGILTEQRLERRKSKHTQSIFECERVWDRRISVHPSNYIISSMF